MAARELLAQSAGAFAKSSRRDLTIRAGVPASVLVGLRIVLRRPLDVCRIRCRIAFDLLVSIVLARVSRILFRHEGRSARQFRTRTSRRRNRARCCARYWPETLRSGGGRGGIRAV